MTCCLWKKMDSKIRQLLHPKDFFAALWPYRYSSVAFGQCNAGSKKWQTIYAVSTTAACLALSFTVVYDRTMIITADRSNNGQVLIAWTNLIVNIIIPPIHIWTWFFAGQMYYKDTVSSLTMIDQELVQVPHCRMNFGAMVIRQVVCLALLMFLYVTIVLSYSYVEIKPYGFDWGQICRMCAVWYPSTIRIASCCSFSNIVVFIGERYVLINHALEYVNSSNNVKNEMSNQANEVIDEILMMKKLRVIHGKLFFVSRKIMDAFALQILACFLVSLICGIIDLYQLYASQTSPCKLPLYQLLNSVIDTVNDFGSIIYVAYSCHKTMQKGNEATRIINSIVVHNEQLHFEASSFSHQLMHYRLLFSPFGLFQLDLTSLQSMIATMSLYLIIFIQLQPSYIGPDCTKSGTD